MAEFEITSLRQVLEKNAEQEGAAEPRAEEKAAALKSKEEVKSKPLSFETREDVIKNIEIDFLLSIVAAKTDATIESLQEIKALIEEKDIPALRETAIKLLDDEELIQAEANYKNLPVEYEKAQKNLDTKYMDAEALDVSKAPYQNGDELGRPLLIEEREDLLTRRILDSGKMVRITIEEYNALSEIREKTQEAEGIFTGDRNKQSILEQKVDDLSTPLVMEPPERLIVEALFHLSDDLTDRNKSRTQELAAGSFDFNAPGSLNKEHENSLAIEALR